MNEIIFRKDKIVELCKNKSVLHLGFIQHSHLYESLIEKGEWLHEKINQTASSLIGIDYLKNDVHSIRKKFGYDCYYGDVMNLNDVNINKTFDVIICGELIEHIENPGLMLDGLKRFMHENSLLVITTPNPWSSNRLKLLNKNNEEKNWLNPEHVSWFSHQTLTNLLKRKGYIESNYTFYYSETGLGYYIQKGLIATLRNIIKRLRINYTKKYHFNGLFFITKLKK